MLHYTHYVDSIRVLRKKLVHPDCPDTEVIEKQLAYLSALAYQERIEKEKREKFNTKQTD